MPHEEAYNGVLKALGDMAQEWRIYRDTINRAISILNHEVIAFGERQQQIVLKIESIVEGQAQIRRWQSTRLAVEIAALLAIAAFVYGMSHG
jgi:hypothetical protein